MLWIPRFARTAALAQSFKLDRKEAWKTARVAPQSGDPIFRRRQHTQPANACPLTDSSLKGTGFELPVRGRGQSGCRPFYAAESSGRVGAPLSVFGQHDALHQSGVDPTAEAAILQTGITADVYIDGFNLYYGALRKTPYNWLNLRRLCEFLLPGNPSPKSNTTRRW